MAPHWQYLTQDDEAAAVGEVAKVVQQLEDSVSSHYRVTCDFSCMNTGNI